MLKIVWIFDSLAKPLAIFYMTPICAYSRVKYICQRIFSEKKHTNNSHALGIFIIAP